MSRACVLCLGLLIAGSFFSCGAPEWIQPFHERREWGPRRPDVIYVPTPQTVIEQMLRMAALKPDDLLYDLGCGDGRIVVTAARQYGVQGRGYDIDPIRVQEAQENARRFDVEQRVQFEVADIFALDFSQATVVTLYLLPSLNKRLMPQLARLRPGSRIVSHDFPMGAAIPDDSIRLYDPETDREHYVFLWRVPWRTDPAGRPQGPQTATPGGR
ncbi:MAG: class I SAM-dependent methyltransferase [Leptospirales bacterium]|nr:class I SAM-dependent methyltransferase [Leptospirales bacterium]